MTEREELIAEIGDLEWPMFQSVNGDGAKASCQLDEGRFRRMRACQYRAWSTPHLLGWLDDLRAAKADGRNLPAEKYIRMMAAAHPDEFALLKEDLAPLEPECESLIDEICAVHLDWKRELDALYPNLARRGRSASDSDGGGASFANYLRSELQTCSPRTIRIYHSDTMEKLARGGNEAMEITLYQVRDAGFADLAEADRSFRK